MSAPATWDDVTRHVCHVARAETRPLLFSILDTDLLHDGNV